MVLAIGREQRRRQQRALHGPRPLGYGFCDIELHETALPRDQQAVAACHDSRRRSILRVQRQVSEWTPFRVEAHHVAESAELAAVSACQEHPVDRIAAQSVGLETRTDPCHRHAEARLPTVRGEPVQSRMRAIHEHDERPGTPQEDEGHRIEIAIERDGLTLVTRRVNANGLIHASTLHEHQNEAMPSIRDVDDTRSPAG